MRPLAMAYGLACYLFFLGVFLYAIGFVGDLGLPTSVDRGVDAPLPEAVLVDLGLLTLFALQHSIMARPAFKRWWTKIVPQPIERSTYVLFASAALALLFWQWRPIDAVVWQADGALAIALEAGFFLGWGVVLLSTFLISHFELFGLRQVWLNMRARKAEETSFRSPLLYGFVRHPIYLGFIIAFWSAPMMTMGHLLFAAVTLAYILVAIQFEERDLIGMFGDQYRAYRRRVSMLLPLPPRA